MSVVADGGVVPVPFPVVAVPETETAGAVEGTWRCDNPIADARIVMPRRCSSGSLSKYRRVPADRSDINPFDSIKLSANVVFP